MTESVLLSRDIAVSKISTIFCYIELQRKDTFEEKQIGGRGRIEFWIS